jgi:hypothetical protein
MVLYTVEQCGFLHELYVKCCFARKRPSTRGIRAVIKKFRFTASLLDKKPARKRLLKKRLEDTGSRYIKHTTEITGPNFNLLKWYGVCVHVQKEYFLHLVQYR